jgi:3-oxoadipate enol-lactonase
MLNYREAGAAGSANVLVLLHGFPFHSGMWRPQLEEPPAGWRVIAPDLPGFGGSAAAVAGDELGMDDAADAVASLVRGLTPDPVVVCGLSMGGYVAFALVRRHAALLRGLILCDTRSGPDSAEVGRGRLQAAVQVMQTGTAGLIDSMLPKLLARQTRAQRPVVEAELREIMEAAAPAAVAGALRGLAARPDSTPQLRSIVVPTQIIVGAEDAITPPGESQLMVRGIPGALLEQLPDAGHVSNLENPAAFNRTLHTFLQPLTRPAVTT